MTWNNILIWLASGLVFLGGCARPKVDLAVELSPDAYTVSVKILEYDDKAGDLLVDSSEKTIAKIMAREGTLVTPMPTVHLMPGHSREVDRRQEYPFLVALGTHGGTNRYESVTTGEYLRVTLSLMPSGAPALGIQLDAPRVVGWEDVPGPGGITYKHPIRRTTLANSTLSPPWSTWQIVDKDETAAVVVRVDRPTLSPLL